MKALLVLLLFAAEAGAQTWAPASSMTYARSEFNAVPLLDGRVFAVGGDIEADLPTELYRASDGSWTPSATFTMGIRNTATVLTNGKVLVAGGWSNGECCFDEAVVYDPIAGTFSHTANVLTHPRGGHTATLLHDGRVLLAGSEASEDPVGEDTAELYDPVSNAFTPVPVMSAVRMSHAAALLQDGRVIEIGGQGLSSAEIYDPSLNTWSPAGSMSGVRERHKAVTLPDGRVLVVGGSDGTAPLASAEIYDPNTGLWSPTAPMSIPRSGHTATLLGDGTVLVVGGGSAEIFHPDTETWTATTAMMEVRSGHAATLLPSGAVLITGGGNANGPLSSAEVFMPAGVPPPPIMIPPPVASAPPPSSPPVPPAPAAPVVGVQAFPNPWDTRVNSGPITFFNLPAGSEVTLYTVSGRRVRRLAVIGTSAAWDLRNDSGSAVASGLYLYHVSGSGGDSGKVAVIR